MKVVILAGGMPSTIAEEDEKIPKPMAEIGGHPILWHIMKQYSHFGFNEFVICAGYKSQMIKEFFKDYYVYQSDITVDLKSNEVKILRKKSEDWKVTVLDTGVSTSMRERVLQAAEYLEDDTFLLTYGDCVSDIDIAKLVDKHLVEHNFITVALAEPLGRNEIFAVGPNGVIDQNKDLNSQTKAWVNSCNMVLNTTILEESSDRIDLLETSHLQELAKSGEISFYMHEGFWSPIETKREKYYLEQLWETNQAPWKVWKD